MPNKIFLTRKPPATFFACTTAATACRTPAARARSRRSSIGFRAGATPASNLLQLRKRCALPLLNHGQSRFLYGTGREQAAETAVPQLPQRIYRFDSLEGVYQKKGIAARRKLRRPRKIRQSVFLHGAPRRPRRLPQMPQAPPTYLSTHYSH